MQKVILKKGKEKSVVHRHPWIFSGAIAHAEVSDGQLAAVCAHDGTVLAWGYYNSRTDIAVRLLSFGDRKPDTDLFVNRICASLTLRKVTGITQCTNAYRLIHSEGDMLPGLIVDWYKGHCVMQSLTLGMDKLKVTIAQIINDVLKPESIYERSDHEGRKKEGLHEQSTQVYGYTPEIIEVNENGMLFLVDVRRGQKTGFFCDQRDNRKKVKEIANGRDVLNLFSYTGGFSVAALLGGAKSAVSVDGSGSALQVAHRNCEMNNVGQAHEIIKADVFDYINNNDITQNLIICDPPALAKNKASVNNAARGYKELNLKIISKCPADSFLLTCSCSRFIDHKLFQQIVFAACNDAGRDACIVGRYSQPADHPVNIYCPETEYLKALLLYIY
ncbi:MAG TPA: class I SAM-dependent rRNA methyltransferase [Spirochaetota bacterium]|nr:class I SAM-dependent rRNA methyltransferase [Spirochaetota bacterium]HOM10285.1 class I SAM-dependent rRNA methyltransferase [Spirochaetota bacterium]HPP50128.1 class I SAM-dependent rRNA methyltransferase [Spirochaetota bacterium]